jgi:pyridoxal 5'-phosphate synthase pdxT subunit
LRDRTSFMPNRNALIPKSWELRISLRFASVCDLRTTISIIWVKDSMEHMPAPEHSSPDATRSLTIGVLALQGDYEAHARAFAVAGTRTVLVRKAEDLAGIDGLVMPGGESTTMLKFLDQDGFFTALKDFASNTPCFATCAGCILLAREVLHPPQRSLGVFDATVERNAYGRQIDSTIISAQTELPGGPLEMVFIRAPRITRVGNQVEVLAWRDSYPTLVRQGHLLVATFHPEMTADTRVQKLFLEMVAAHKAQSK